MTTHGPSRPFRWFGLLLAGWILFRALAIWAGGPASARQEPRAIASNRSELSHDPGRSNAIGLTRRPAPILILPYRAGGTSPSRRRIVLHETAPYVVPTVKWASRAPDDDRMRPRSAPSAPSALSVGVATWTTPSPAKRLSASIWLLLREEGAEALGSGSELGGSQVGARLFYTVATPIAATARVSHPIARPQEDEASIGIALRHGNVGLLLERRIALGKGGRNDFSATAYGGIDDVPLPYGMRADGYVQAGVVGDDAFVDGAAHIERKIATLNKARISIGAGAWGGAQPGAERVDIGPQVVARVPVGAANARVSAEWRQRVAGRAAPRSGPSLTIGMDF